MLTESARYRALANLNVPSPSPSWGDKCESFRVDRYHWKHIAGRCASLVMSEKTKVMKTKTAIKQELEPCILSDLKHDLQCRFVKLGDSDILLLAPGPPGPANFNVQVDPEGTSRRAQRPLASDGRTGSASGRVLAPCHWPQATDRGPSPVPFASASGT